MEYQVPQFIEVEDRIVGPLTLRQFIYLAGTAGITVTFFIFLPLLLAIVLAAPIIALGLALSFYKVNGKSFIEMLEAGFNYYTRAKLFLWRREETAEADRKSAAAAAASAATAAAEKAARRAQPQLTRGRLSELAWSLDVQQPTSGSQQTTKEKE